MVRAYPPNGHNSSRVDGDRCGISFIINGLYLRVAVSAGARTNGPFPPVRPPGAGPSDNGAWPMFRGLHQSRTEEESPVMGFLSGKRSAKFSDFFLYLLSPASGRGEVEVLRDEIAD